VTGILPVIGVYSGLLASSSSSSALRYKPEGRGFDSWWCHWNFSLTYPFRPHYDLGVDSACNRNEYQEYFLGDKGSQCVGLTTLSPSCLEIWEAQPPGTPRSCSALYRECFTFFFYRVMDRKSSTSSPHAISYHSSDYSLIPIVLDHFVCFSPLNLNYNSLLGILILSIF
jgi:hypothetical protein